VTDEKKHPDEVVKMLSDLAAQHGYALMAAELTGSQPVGLSLPRYTYNME
jgi:hypothetical protein